MSVTPLPLDQQLTHDQCQALAAALADLPPQYQLTPAEIEMLEEGLFQQNLRYGEPARAAAAMKARLAHLRREKARALDTMDDCAESLFAELSADIHQLNTQIAEHQQRLADYLRQQGTAN